MSSKNLLAVPMDLNLPPTPPMDLNDNSNDFKVSSNNFSVFNESRHNAKMLEFSHVLVCWFSFLRNQTKIIFALIKLIIKKQQIYKMLRTTFRDRILVIP